MIKINRKQEVITVSVAYEKFIKNRRVSNLREASLEHYRYSLNYFVNFVGADTPITAISAEEITDFIIFWQDKKVTVSTINSHLRRVKAFMNFCFESFDIKPFKIKLMKMDEVIREPYSEDELKRLVREPKTEDFREWRTWIIVNFFLATGCRVGTAVEVKVGDIDFEGGFVFLRRNKNRKQQIIPLSTSLRKALKTWLSLWDAEEDDYLFPSGKTREKMLTRSVSHDIAKYNAARGVETTGCHRFRNTFAKNYIMSGGGALQLQQILGHSSITMTQHYVKLYSQDLAVNFDSFCCLDSLR